MTQNQTHGPKRGRPKKTDQDGNELTKVTICIFPDQAARLIDMGQGNLSEGVRRLVDEAQENGSLAQVDRGQAITYTVTG